MSEPNTNNFQSNVDIAENTKMWTKSLKASRKGKCHSDVEVIK